MPDGLQGRWAKKSAGNQQQVEHFRPELVTSRESETALAYPGVPRALDGSSALVAMETTASEAAGAYPITPSTQMGEGWAEAVARGQPNVHGRRLIFFEPEGEHAAAGVTAGMSMVGLRSASFSSGQGVAYMHESLYAAVGKRLTYVLNIACRAISKQSLNIHCGHDDYHAIDDTGMFQLFAKDVQEVADLNLIAHRIAELSLNPGVCAQDGFLTSHVIESLRLPESELVAEYLGDPDDLIESPTPAQRMVFGERRRRIPELFDLDSPTMLGSVQNQDSYAQGVAAQRPFYFDHLVELSDRAFAEFAELAGRHYARTSAYRLEDAEYVIVGQGSVVPNAEAVCDYLREARGLAVGVVNLTMFRPFPSDLVAEMLRGRKGVVVLERVDQPLAADPPLLREIRTALAKALENGRAADESRPHRDLPGIQPHELPDCYSGCYGLGSRDTQPGDLIAAVEEMLPGRRGRRQFYLGIDFLRKDSGSPALEDWQREVAAGYPQLAELALERADAPNLLPDGSLALRIHSIGGWGAITVGKSISQTLFELVGVHVKSNPKYGSEKKGQPTTFFAVFAHEPIRLNCALRHVDVVLSPDPNAFHHSNPLEGLARGGVLVIQSHQKPGELWDDFPAWARDRIRSEQIRVFTLDGFAIAQEEASNPELRFRMQGAAFLGAFFRASPVLEREQLAEAELFEGIREQLQKQFGRRGPQVVADNYRVIRRGFDEAQELDWASLEGEVGETEAAVSRFPASLRGPRSESAIADRRGFFEQVCLQYRSGADPLADPFVALSAIPAATGVFRDMSGIRLEVPTFIADRCTGCGQCWVQCPDAAIPGLVTGVEELLETALEFAAEGGGMDGIRRLVSPLAAEVRRRLDEESFSSFTDTLRRAYGRVALDCELDTQQRDALDDEFGQLLSALADFPLAKTVPFYTVPERAEQGSGGLLSITINPSACKGCNLCVDVCPDGALVPVKQDRQILERLRHSWSLWEQLPDTPDRFINVRDLERGIGVLSTLLLKKGSYRSMVGGDGACSGCGEKTVVHLIVAATEAAMQERVAPFVVRLDGLIERLEVQAGGPGSVTDATRSRWLGLIEQLKELRWRYQSGPSGAGRCSLGIANATGCSSVWAGTYPYNPYPFPWVNHLFQDAPSVAIGIFEGQMRKMADAFRVVRQAELELEGAYEPELHEPFFAAFDWREFTDEEFLLCPPIFAVGGDGAMLDIGFQNLSRLLASGKPLRVVVLDTQVYSNTGGQACTSGFLGQVSDMAGYGAGQRGKEEIRKELALLAIADWAATEARFAAHFSRVERSSWGEAMLPFHEYLQLSTQERVEKTPFVHALDRQGCLDRLQVSEEIVQLAEERLALWSELKEMSGAALSPRVRDAVISEVEREYERREAALRAEYEARLADQATGRASAAANRIVDCLLQEIGR
jgi:pyruvate-ferredoxin/flavodoxin oxidoreductase